MSKSDRTLQTNGPDDELPHEQLRKRLKPTADDSPLLSTYWLTGYESGGPFFSLECFLQEAERHIRLHYEVYLESRTRISYAGFWEDVCKVKHRKWPDCSASMLATRVGESEPTGTIGFGPLYVAGAFHQEALQASQGDLKDRAWAALLMCHHFIGMAYGQESVSKRSSRGGQETSRPFAEFNNSFRHELLNWLNGLVDHPPPKKLQTLKAVIDELLPRADVFRDQWSQAREDARGRSQNLSTLMRDLSNDPEVRAAFELVIGKPISRGRPRGSTKEAASQKKTKRSS